jgi:hypothetical protein
MSGNKICTTPEYDALHDFYARNNASSRPPQEIAGDIWKQGLLGQNLIDAIAHAIEDARDFGKRAAPFERDALGSYGTRSEPQTRTACRKRRSRAKSCLK